MINVNSQRSEGDPTPTDYSNSPAPSNRSHHRISSNAREDENSQRRERLRNTRSQRPFVGPNPNESARSSNSRRVCESVQRVRKVTVKTFKTFVDGQEVTFELAIFASDSESHDMILRYSVHGIGLELGKVKSVTGLGEAESASFTIILVSNNSKPQTNSPRAHEISALPLLSDSLSVSLYLNAPIPPYVPPPRPIQPDPNHCITHLLLNSSFQMPIPAIDFFNKHKFDLIIFEEEQDGNGVVQ